MTIESNREQLKTNWNTLGMFLFCIYIFMSYIGNDVLLPSFINSYFLYLFLGYSVIYVIVKKKLMVNSTLTWLAIFMLFSLISLFYSPEKSVFSGTFYFLIVNFILVLFLSQYTYTTYSIEKIAWVYSVSAFVLVLLLALTGNIFDASETGRLGQELLGNANIFATMLMTSSIYTIWLLMYQDCSKFRKSLLLVCLITEYIGMFLSGGRKYIVVPVIFLYILMLHKQDRNGRKHFIKYTLIIAAVIGIIWNIIMKVPMFYDVIGSRMESYLLFLGGDTSHADGSSRIRSQMIEIGLQKWQESILWGYGFDSFKYFNESVTGHFYYSHNNFVEMLYNLGIIGFIAYYSYYIKLLFASYNGKNRISLSARAFSVAMVISMMIYEYGAINYTTTSTMIMFFFASTMLQDELM